MNNDTANAIIIALASTLDADALDPALSAIADALDADDAECFIHTMRRIALDDLAAALDARSAEMLELADELESQLLDLNANL